MRAAATCFLFLLLGASSASADEIRVAAAADLKFVMQELAARFEQQTGHRVNVTYGSSGNFLSQIQNGAPFDLFFSADIEYPRRLETAGLAAPGTLYRYAVGRIVVWVPAGSPVDVSKGWNALLDSSVQKIAIANPQHAPYGRAAVAALQKAGIHQKIAAKLVYGEDVSQAAQFVESDNAQAGIIALSLAMSPALRGKGRWWEIPAEAHPPIEQGVIVLQSSAHQETARAFLDFVKSAQGRTLLEQFGFTIPGIRPATQAQS